MRRPTGRAAEGALRAGGLCGARDGNGGERAAPQGGGAAETSGPAPRRNVIVHKYGGSSLASPEHIRRVAERVARTRRSGADVVVVVSAMGDTTDELLDLLARVARRPPAREIDMLLTSGEQVSVALLAAALEDAGCPARSFLGWQAGIETDGVHRKARIRRIEAGRIRAALAEGRVAVVAGFQGITADAEVTTLGRGGSDTTAVALAAALDASSCEICSDVDGVYTADPRVVPDARRLDVVSYEEMMELSSVGAQVLQLRAVEVAERHGVTIVARSTFVDGPGTRITGVEGMEDATPARGVAIDRNVAKIVLFGVPDRPGIAHRLFAALAEHHINVDMIIQSASRDTGADISFTVAREDMERAGEVAADVGRELGAQGCQADADVGKVSLVGAGMASRPGVAATMFGALSGAGINIEMITTSEIRISCVVRAADVDAAVRAVHAAFDLGRSGASGAAAEIDT
jgi:aspartate kinase